MKLNDFIIKGEGCEVIPLSEKQVKGIKYLLEKEGLNSDALIVKRDERFETEFPYLLLNTKTHITLDKKRLTNTGLPDLVSLYGVTLRKLSNIDELREKALHFAEFQLDVRNHGLYSFRFNEERRSVTLYKNGVKVQFVKPHQDDKFSWKIGLGVTLYKELFNNGRDVPKDVEYMKSILNWKMFYTYIVAYVVKFDKDKLDRLDVRVKMAKLYKEIKIND